MKIHQERPNWSRELRIHSQVKKNQIQYLSGEVRLEQEQQQRQTTRDTEKRSNPNKNLEVGSSQKTQQERWKNQEEEWGGEGERGRFFCAETTEICYAISETECRPSAITLDLGMGQWQEIKNRYKMAGN